MLMQVPLAPFQADFDNGFYVERRLFDRLVDENECFEEIEFKIYRDIAVPIDANLTKEGILGALGNLGRNESAQDDSFHDCFVDGMRDTTVSQILYCMCEKDERLVYAYTPFLMALQLREYDLCRRLNKKGYVPEKGYVLKGRPVIKRKKRRMGYTRGDYYPVSPLEIALEDENVPEDIMNIIFDNMIDFRIMTFFDDCLKPKQALKRALKLFDMDGPDFIKKGFFGDLRFINGGRTRTPTKYSELLHISYELLMELAERVRDDEYMMILLLNSYVAIGANYMWLDSAETEARYDEYMKYKMTLLKYCGDNKKLKEIWLYSIIKDYWKNESHGIDADEIQINEVYFDKIKKVVDEENICVSDERFIWGFPGYYCKAEDIYRFEDYRSFNHTKLSLSRMKVYENIVERKITLAYSVRLLKEVKHKLNDLLSHYYCGHEYPLNVYEAEKLFSLIDSFKGDPLKGKMRRTSYIDLVNMIVNSGTEETVEMLLDSEMINDEAVDVAIEESLKINRIELIPLLMSRLP